METLCFRQDGLKRLSKTWSSIRTAGMTFSTLSAVSTTSNCNPEKRESVFALSESELLASPDEASDEAASEAGQGIDPSTGRPGMVRWNILVLGVFKQALDCDYDRPESLANHYDQVRIMLGHGDVCDKVRYNRRMCGSRSLDWNQWIGVWSADLGRGGAVRRGEHDLMRSQ